MMQDFTTLRRGVLREILPPPKADSSSSAGHQVGSEQHEQCITLNNERFTVPELLFNPSDVGIIQVGSQIFPNQFLHSFIREGAWRKLSNVRGAREFNLNLALCVASGT